MILVVVGTRPELVKMAPVVQEARDLGLPVHVHCTMQSSDLVDRNILPWDTEGDADDLRWTRPGRKSLLHQASLVVVQGDTRTAFEMAVMAFEYNVPVFHVEAGVRTYDLSSPWPEEGYRQMISRIARWHACTTPATAENLVMESVANWQRIRVTGSPVVESVRQRAGAVIVPDSHVLLTLHRRENRPHFADILRGVVDTIGTTRHVIWPSHPNHWAVAANPTSLAPVPPMDPWRFARSLAGARLVITDSGGVQEEANALGIPCVVARSVTDRPESLGAGGAILGGVARETVAAAVEVALQMDPASLVTDCYGDGTASRQIVDWWAEILA